MKIIRAKDYNDMSRKAANIISAQVILKPESVLGLATGSSPIGIYEQLIKWYHKGDVDFGAMEYYQDTVPFDTDHAFDDMARRVGTKAMFFGHELESSMSILDGDMRYTFGLKTGLHNSYRLDHVGGTLITADSRNVKV